MSYWTKQRSVDSRGFVLKLRDRIKSFLDSVTMCEKHFLTFSVVSEICFWLCVESVIRASSFHTSYNAAESLYEVFKSFGLFVLKVKVSPKM